MDFYVIHQLTLYNDCRFSAKELYTIDKNEIIKKIYAVGPWLKVIYKGVTGWVYPFNDTLGICIKDKNLHNLEERSKIGSLVHITPNKNKEFYKDKNGKIIRVIDNGSKLFFTIVDYGYDNYVLVKGNNPTKTYYIKDSDLDIMTYQSLKYRHADSPGELLDTANKASEYTSTSDYYHSDTSGTAAATASTDTNKANTQSKQKNVSTETVDDPSKIKAVLESYYSETNSSTENAKLKTDLKYLRSIFGMPYQYLPIADLRTSIDGAVSESFTDYSLIGMKYREKILSRMPLLVLQPGIVDFMPSFNKDEQTTIIKELVSQDSETSGEGNLSQLKEQMLNKTRASYYTFYPAWNVYFRYVNTTCRMAAVFMGVQNKYITLPDGSKAQLSTINWKSMTPNYFHKSFYRGSCAFYLNSEVSQSESFSNATTQSQIASKTNNLSDSARELDFISNNMTNAMSSVGGKIGGGVASLVQPAQNKYNSLFANDLQKKIQSQGVVSAVLNGVQNTIAGAKMVFPELWQDSNFSRDYSCTIKLDSPDNDPLSVYLNVIVPLIHLICFVAPKGTGPTTYASPFLIRGCYQGFFNVNLGIISDMEIEKGGEGDWTFNNVPTSVTVRLTIKDLFATNFLSMTTDDNINLNTLTNQPFVDYIGNLCGLNIDEPDWQRFASIAKMMIYNRTKDILTLQNVTDSLTAWYDNSNNNTYASISAGKVPTLNNALGTIVSMVK